MLLTGKDLSISADSGEREEKSEKAMGKEQLGWGVVGRGGGFTKKEKKDTLTNHTVCSLETIQKGRKIMQKGTTDNPERKKDNPARQKDNAERQKRSSRKAER